MARTRVKICCMGSIDEANMAIAAGADAIGLVSAMPSGPGPIDEELICRIAAYVPRAVGTFLLTPLTAADAIVAQHERCLTSTIQLVDFLDDGAHQAIRRALPGVRLVQVIHVGDDSSIDEAKDVAPFVDAILLDSGNPQLAIKELGGTGRTHNWEVSTKLVRAVDVPVFLAGGLRADNVQRAIGQVQPYGVDVCSGVRTDGRLDKAKLDAFMAAVRSA
ncbi:MAG: phosphoribosylanthranilate isomerase [Gemmatimonadaceae bacterium]